MNKKQYIFILALALIAGLLGGMVSSHFFVGQSVFAANEAEVKTVVVSQEFRLVDKEGNTRAFLGFGHAPMNEGQPKFEMYSKGGFPLAVLGVNSFMTEEERLGGERSRRPPRSPSFSLVLLRENGTVLWRVP